jgi:hypothetical protein
MCVQGIERYSPRVYNEIIKCIEMGKGGDGVEIRGSWIVTMGGKGMVGGMRGEGIRQWAVVDSFDLILDLTPSATATTTTTPSTLQALSCILSLHTHGYIPKASIPLNTYHIEISIANRSVNTVITVDSVLCAINYARNYCRLCSLVVLWLIWMLLRLERVPWPVGLCWGTWPVLVGRTESVLRMLSASRK